MGPVQMHMEANLTSPWKVKRQCTTIILATLLDLLAPMICAKIQPQGILCSGEDNTRFDNDIVVWDYSVIFVRGSELG